MTKDKPHIRLRFIPSDEFPCKVEWVRPDNYLKNGGPIGGEYIAEGATIDGVLRAAREWWKHHRRWMP